MSARGRLEFVLLKYFSATEDVTPATAGELEKLQVATLVDGFAHELAEQLRGEIGPADYPGESDHIKRFVAGWRGAANFIDPEVTA